MVDLIHFVDFYVSGYVASVLMMQTDYARSVTDDPKFVIDHTSLTIFGSFFSWLLAALIIIGMATDD